MNKLPAMPFKDISQRRASEQIITISYEKSKARKGYIHRSLEEPKPPQSRSGWRRLVMKRDA